MPIFDQGYQHWHGPLSGHLWRWLTITRQGVRVQMKNRLLRLLMLVSWLPCVALIGVMVLWGLIEQRSAGVLALVSGFLPSEVTTDPHAYRVVVWTLAYSFFFKTQSFFIMLLVAFAGPGLISQDLRFNALPLYLARPLTRLDYFLGKLGVIGALVGSVAVGPAVFAYVVGACFALDLSIVRDTYPVLLASIAYGLVITLSVGTLMLALSSLSRRSLYIGITWAGLWLISSTTASILTNVNAESDRREAYVTEMQRWMDQNPPPPGAKMSGGFRSGGVSFGPYPQVKANPKTGRYGLIGVAADREAEGERWYEAWMAESQLAWVKADQAQGAGRRRDWRPLCSYVGNMERLADQLLDTDGAWVTIGRAVERSGAAVQRVMGPGGRRRPRAEPAPSYDRRFADQMVPQYPWVWSAGVLAVLLGLSTWILTRRVKSLDRLR